MVESMAVIKGLVAGDTVAYNGRELKIPWIEEGWDLPMWVAGYGPKALATIGEHADGFILQLADPQILEWTMGAVKEAAAAAGRDPDEVKICVVAPAYVGDDLGHQRDQLRWFGGMVGNHVADMVNRYGDDSAEVPQALTDYIKAREGYDYAKHGKSDSGSVDFVPDGIIDRFCVLGPVEAHIEKMTLLKDMGVDHFGVYLMHDDMEGTLRAYGESIIPALS
jgi:probable F420-dependent oxidoreductase